MSSSPKRFRNKLQLSCAALVAVAAQACVAPLEDESQEAFSSTEQPILNGTPVTVNDIGVVAVYHGNFSRPCSGTFLGNRWVVTARHCLENDAGTENSVLRPNQLFVTGDVNPGPQRPSTRDLAIGSWANVSAIFLNPQTTPFTGTSSSTTVDVAILRLDRNLNSNLVRPQGSRITNTRALVGKQLLCAGYGRSNPRFFTLPDTPISEVFAGSGALLKAFFTVTSVGPAIGDGNRTDGPFQIQIVPSSSSQSLAHGDSGGPCFLPYSSRNGGGVILASVARFGTTVVSIGTDTSYASWMSTVLARTGD